MNRDARIMASRYWIENRALHIVGEHAAFVRDLFRRDLELGNVVRLKAVLDQENVRLPIRTDCGGKRVGGGPISRGHLYKILSNPIYVGHCSSRLKSMKAFTTRSSIKKPGPVSKAGWPSMPKTERARGRTPTPFLLASSLTIAAIE
jgi:hypothetical protein